MLSPQFGATKCGRSIWRSRTKVFVLAFHTNVQNIETIDRPFLVQARKGKLDSTCQILVQYNIVLSFSNSQKKSWTSGRKLRSAAGVCSSPRLLYILSPTGHQYRRCSRLSGRQSQFLSASTQLALNFIMNFDLICIILCLMNALNHQTKSRCYSEWHQQSSSRSFSSNRETNLWQYTKNQQTKFHLIQNDTNKVHQGLPVPLEKPSYDNSLRTTHWCSNKFILINMADLLENPRPGSDPREKPIQTYLGGGGSRRSWQDVRFCLILTSSTGACPIHS